MGFSRKTGNRTGRTCAVVSLLRSGARRTTINRLALASLKSQSLKELEVLLLGPDRKDIETISSEFQLNILQIIRKNTISARSLIDTAVSNSSADFFALVGPAIILYKRSTLETLNLLFKKGKVLLGARIFWSTPRWTESRILSMLESSNPESLAEFAHNPTGIDRETGFPSVIGLSTLNRFAGVHRRILELALERYPTQDPSSWWETRLINCLRTPSKSFTLLTDAISVLRLFHVQRDTVGRRMTITEQSLKEYLELCKYYKLLPAEANVKTFRLRSILHWNEAE